MGHIYSQSELTIIAAAGDDSGYGLPGVSSRPRYSQSHLQIGDLHFLSINIYPEHYLMKKTKWASRGWTLQEALLSRRRIVFTDEQVWFYCNSLHLIESVSHATLSPDKQSFGMRSFQSFTLDTGRPETIIEEYSLRNLTYASDALNGCLGILNKTRDLRDGFRHIWGLPTQIHPPNEVTRQKISINLSWRTNVPARRRVLFPSWSWTGWEGAISFGRDCSQIGLDCEIEVGDTEQQMQPLRRVYLESEQANGTSDAPRMLIITAPIVPLDCSGSPPQDENSDCNQHEQARLYRDISGRFQMSFPLNEGICLDGEVFEDGSSYAEELEDFLMMLIQSSGYFFACLLLKPKSSIQHFVRVGLVTIPRPSSPQDVAEHAPSTSDRSGNRIDPSTMPEYVWQNPMWLKTPREGV